MALNPRNTVASLGAALTVECAEVRIPCGDAVLFGDLALPPRFSGLVLFAHGSGSGRHSARNRQVAKALQNAGIGTLLFDLLTTDEERADSLREVNQTTQRDFGIFERLPPVGIHNRCGGNGMNFDRQSRKLRSLA